VSDLRFHFFQMSSQAPDQFAGWIAPTQLSIDDSLLKSIVVNSSHKVAATVVDVFNHHAVEIGRCCELAKPLLAPGDNSSMA
jgi:hypothetical protein